MAPSHCWSSASSEHEGGIVEANANRTAKRSDEAGIIALISAAVIEPS